MPIVLRRNNPESLEWALGGESSNRWSWMDVCYQNGPSEVGLDVDSIARAFLQRMLLGAFALNRETRCFVQFSGEPIKHFHDLHNVARLSLIKANASGLQKVEEVNQFQASTKQRLLKVKYGLHVGQDIEPFWLGEKIGEVPMSNEMLSSLTASCEACFLLRRNESGLLGLLISEFRDSLSTIICSAAGDIELRSIDSTSPLPAW